MHYDPTKLKSEAHISDALASIPKLSSLFTTLKDLQLSPVLFGGAVRDLAAFGRATGDYDLITITTETDPKARYEHFQTAIVGWAARQGLKTSVYPNDHIAMSKPDTDLSIDVHYPCHQPIEKLIRSDFTINGAAFDCSTGNFCDPLGGIDDLRTGTLKVHSPEYVITNAPNFPRMFRTACRVGLPITGKVEELIRRSAPCMALHDSKVNSRTFLELLKFLSLPKMRGYLTQFCELKLFEMLFPEWSTLSWVEENSASIMSGNIARAEQLDEFNPSPEWSAFLETPLTRAINNRGYLRFVLLCDRLGTAYAILGKESPFAKEVSNGDSSLFAARMQRNLTGYAAARYTEYPDILRLIQDTVPLIALSESWSSAPSAELASALKLGLETTPAAAVRRSLVLAAVRSAKQFTIPAYS